MNSGGKKVQFWVGGGGGGGGGGETHAGEWEGNIPGCPPLPCMKPWYSVSKAVVGTCYDFDCNRNLAGSLSIFCYFIENINAFVNFTPGIFFL